MYEPQGTVPDANPLTMTRLVMRLIFVGVLLLYAVMILAQLAVRFVSPSLFPWGAGFLPAGHGMFNTLALIVCCASIASARRISAQTNRWLMIAALSATFIGGVVFLAIQSVEYENSFRQGLGWGTTVSGGTAGAEIASGELGPGDIAVGQTRWNATCRSCHGAGGEGVEGQGKDLRQSVFVQGLDDTGLLTFIKAGRAVSDPANTTSQPMPPKGGNPLLKDPQLMDVIAYIRSIQISSTDTSSQVAGDGDAAADATDPPVNGDAEGTSLVETNSPEQAESNTGFWIPRSSVPLAALGPSGLSDKALQPLLRPARANVFFGFFFLMTGLHAFQVVVGLLILAWLIFRAVQIQYRPAHGVPVDLACRYWYLTTLIWVVLFPLFYLIR